MWKLLLRRYKCEYELQTVLTALCFDAESVFKAFVRMSTGDDLRFGATNVYILLAMDDVTAVALQSMDYKMTEKKIHPSAECVIRTHRIAQLIKQNHPNVSF